MANFTIPINFSVSLNNKWGNPATLEGRLNNEGCRLKEQGTRKIVNFYKRNSNKITSTNYHTFLKISSKAEKDYSKAEKLFRRAIDQEFDFSIAYYNLGNIYVSFSLRYKIRSSICRSLNQKLEAHAWLIRAYYCQILAYIYYLRSSFFEKRIHIKARAFLGFAWTFLENFLRGIYLLFSYLGKSLREIYFIFFSLTQATLKQAIRKVNSFQLPTFSYQTDRQENTVDNTKPLDFNLYGDLLDIS